MTPHDRQRVMPEFTGHKDLRAYLRILWRWKLLFLALVVAAPVAAYLIQRGNPRMYRSTALVGVNGATVNTGLLAGGGSFSTTNVTAIAQLVTTTPVAADAARLLHPPGNPGEIAGEVSATGDPTTNFLTISADDRSPARAAAIANAFARAISNNQQQAALTQIDRTIAGIKAQLAQLKPTDTVTRPGLQVQLRQLIASRATQSSGATILQPATPSGAPVGLNTRRTVEIGLVIGLLLAFGAIALAENADRRLRTPGDLEGLTDLPLLAAIAPSAFSGKLDTTKEDDEAFQMLRTSLMYFNVDRTLESIVVTSPGEKEGKTTVATRLALAAARTGLHVILVDADLRRSQVSAKLDIRAKQGLEAVLAGERTLSETLVDYPVEGPGSGRLSVVPAGPPPPNPSALISSEAMQRVLRQLVSYSDLVIIDTPAALAVSDPLPLMRSVSGVVLVARMNRSSRQTIQRLQRIITSANGTLLGVVATGVSSGPGYEGYAHKYYTSNGTRGPGPRGRFRRRSRTNDPEVSATRGDPEVSAAQGDPEESATQGDPEDRAPQGDPEVAATEDDPKVSATKGD